MSYWAPKFWNARQWAARYWAKVTGAAPPLDVEPIEGTVYLTRSLEGDVIVARTADASVIVTRAIVDEEELLA